MNTDTTAPVNVAERWRFFLALVAAVVLGWFFATIGSALLRDDTAITVSEGSVAIPARQIREGYAGFWRGAEGPLEQGVLVLFDPMCPHCGDLWEALADEPIPQFWVPVAILDETRSNELGAILIETQAREADAPAQMSRFKTTLERDPALDRAPTRDTLELTQRNTRLFFETGRSSVPVIVMKSAGNKYKILNGSMSAEAFRQAFKEFHNESR